MRDDIVAHLATDPEFLDDVRGSRGPPGPPGPSGFGGSSSHSGGGGDNIKARDIGFFWPDCAITDSQPEGPTVVASNGDVIYRSHARFFGRLDDVIATFPYEKVKVQLIQCLRGIAQDWYANELDEIDRQGIRDDSSRTFKVFKARCAVRFAKTSLEANRLLSETKFGVQDIRSGTRFATYAHKKMLYAEEAGYVSPDDPLFSKKKLDFVYNDLDPALRLYIEAPTEKDTVRDYMAKISAKENSWIDYYSSRGKRIPDSGLRPATQSTSMREQKYLPSMSQSDKNRYVKQISGQAGGGQKAPPSKPCPAHLRERGEEKYHWLQQCDLPSVVAGRQQFKPKSTLAVKAYLGENPVSVEEMCTPDFLQAYYAMGSSTVPDTSSQVNPYEELYPDAFHVGNVSDFDLLPRFETMDSSDSSSNANTSACFPSFHSNYVLCLDLP